LEHISLLSSIGLKAMVAPIAVFNPAIQRKMNKARALRCTGPMLFLSGTLAYYYLLCSEAYFCGFQCWFGGHGRAHRCIQSCDPAKNEQLQNTAMHRVNAPVKKHPYSLSDDMQWKILVCFPALV
jgi:hypothetical protein